VAEAGAESAAKARDNRRPSNAPMPRCQESTGKRI